RASHEPRHAHLRSRQRAQLRPQDRRRLPRRGPREPGCDRGLPRKRRRRVSARSLLELNDVEARYGPVLALRGISLAVPEGAIVAVLGANGAGKTTTLRSVSGTVKRSGEILLDGKPLRGGPESSAKAGVAHVPGGRGPFTELSVTENLRLGAYTRRTRSLRADIERMATYFPWISERGEQRAGTL